MNWLCKLFRQDPDSREGLIAATSGIGVIVNLLIAAVKVVLGFLTSSIAITSEGVNNAADALTSVLTLIGTKLAGKHPDSRHPFGYGRIEYLTSLVISVLIVVTGAEMLTGSVRRIFEPEEMSVSTLSLIIVAVSAVMKFLLGLFTIRMGKKAESTALEAVGVESRNDSFISIVTIVSAAVFLIFHFSIDAYAGAITSLFILKAGLEVLRDTVSQLLGKPGDGELAEELYREIRSTDGVIGAADMMLHNYGPDAYSGSVNVEIDHRKSVGEIYQFLHALQLRIMHEYNVVLVFGVYAVDNDGELSKKIRRDVAAFVKEREHVKSFHAIYLDSEAGKLYCDLVADYELGDWDALRAEFTAYMAECWPEYELELTVETEYV